MLKQRTLEKHRMTAFGRLATHELGRVMSNETGLKILTLMLLSPVVFSSEPSSTEGIKKESIKTLISIVCDQYYVQCVGLDRSHCATAIENAMDICWASGPSFEESSANSYEE